MAAVRDAALGLGPILGLLHQRPEIAPRMNYSNHHPIRRAGAICPNHEVWISADTNPPVLLVGPLFPHRAGRRPATYQVEDFIKGCSQRMRRGPAPFVRLIFERRFPFPLGLRGQPICHGKAPLWFDLTCCGSLINSLEHFVGPPAPLVRGNIAVAISLFDRGFEAPVHAVTSPALLALFWRHGLRHRQLLWTPRLTDIGIDDKHGEPSGMASIGGPPA